MREHLKFVRETWFFYRTPPFLLYKKSLKNFRIYLPLKKNFCGYFQQGVYTHFQKISLWTRYDRFSLSQILKIFSSNCNVFALVKWSQKCQVFSSFYLENSLWCLLWVKCVHAFPEDMLETFQINLKLLNCFGCIPPF